MAPLKLQRIISCSNQDPVFPAENLLKGGTNNKWKCKTWEIMTSVVIQLEKPSVITGIDIGNDSSAFIEVLVGCGDDPIEFKIILSMTALMTPMDSQKNQQTNQVRNVQLNDLHLPVCVEKWDKIKVVCSQPFNRAMKFGLAFIKFYGYQAEIEENSSQYELLTSPLLKDSTRKKSPRKAATPKPKAKDSNGKITSTSAGGQKLPSKKIAGDAKKTPPKKQDHGKEQKESSSPRTPSKRSIQDEESSSSPGKKQAKRSPKVMYKPFHKLLEGVELAISGYVNPARADIRSKACSMGAKYWPDWTSTCTHLICAFPNTPKFQKVKGNGKIVGRQWIDYCFTERKRLPWRRYATDPDDREDCDFSDEEVWEEVQNGNGPTSAVRNGTVAKDEDTSSGPRLPVPDRFVATVEQIDSSKPPGNCKGNLTSKPKNEDNKMQSEAVQKKLPEIPDFFKNKFFYVHPSISKGQMERVERCIIAFCGTVSKILDGNIHFAIAKKKFKNEDDAIGVPYVNPEWIWKCNDAGEMISICDYIL